MSLSYALFPEQIDILASIFQPTCVPLPAAKQQRAKHQKYHDVTRYIKLVHESNVYTSYRFAERTNASSPPSPARPTF